MLIASHSIIFAVGFNVGKLSEEEVADSQVSETETPQTTATPIITPTPEQISPEQLQIALNNFPTTSEAIEQIVNELQSKYLEQFPAPQPPEQLFLDIVTAMKESLRTDLKTDLDLQYTGAIMGGFAGEPDKYIEAQREWVEAIYSYQQQFLDRGLGYIEPQQPTAEKLKCDIGDRLGIELETTPDICLPNNPE